MPEVQSIHLNLQTGRMDGAGTDGNVYLGVCGREFYVDTTSDDFERGSTRNYIFGDGANVINKPPNDPRSQRLLTENVVRFPVYIRFQPESGSDNWNLQRAVVTFNGDLFPQWDTASFVRSDNGIWLGTRSGLYVHIPMHQDVVIQ